MNHRTRLTALAFLAAFISIVAYRVGRARADGIPTTNPLYYSGVLENAGAPVPDGPQDLTIRLWDDPTAGNTQCTTVAMATSVTGGRFRVALDSGCVAAIQNHPDLWVEPLIGGISFGRSKVGAVPFAVEAGRASAASGPLATRIAALEHRQVVVGTPVNVPDSMANDYGWTAVPSGPTLSFTAAATGVYRVSGGLETMGVYLRIAPSSGATIVWQEAGFTPVASTLANMERPTAQRALYVQLTAGNVYTFQFQALGQSHIGAAAYATTGALASQSALVAEQLE